MRNFAQATVLKVSLGCLLLGGSIAQVHAKGIVDERWKNYYHTKFELKGIDAQGFSITTVSAPYNGLRHTQTTHRTMEDKSLVGLLMQLKALDAEAFGVECKLEYDEAEKNAARAAIVDELLAGLEQSSISESVPQTTANAPKIDTNPVSISATASVSIDAAVVSTTLMEKNLVCVTLVERVKNAKFEDYFGISEKTVEDYSNRLKFSTFTLSRVQLGTSPVLTNKGRFSTGFYDNRPNPYMWQGVHQYVSVFRVERDTGKQGTELEERDTFARLLGDLVQTVDPRPNSGFNSFFR